MIATHCSIQLLYRSHTGEAHKHSMELTYCSLQLLCTTHRGEGHIPCQQKAMHCSIQLLYTMHRLHLTGSVLLLQLLYRTVNWHHSDCVPSLYSCEIQHLRKNTRMEASLCSIQVLHTTHIEKAHTHTLCQTGVFCTWVRLCVLLYMSCTQQLSSIEQCIAFIWHGMCPSSLWVVHSSCREQWVDSMLCLCASPISCIKQYIETIMIVCLRYTAARYIT